MKSPKSLTLIVAIGLTFLFVLATFESVRNRSYTVIRPALKAKEAFENQELKPDVYDISNADKPYVLLGDTLKTKNCLGMLDAKRCYMGSFQSRIEKTGNYRQLTNNYKHEDVESCSAPFTEVVNSFYDVKPLH